MTETTALLLRAKALLAQIVDADPQGAMASDAELIESTEAAEQVSLLLDVVKTRRAAEIDRRSRRELGSSGLAARRGFVNAPSFLRSVTRSSFGEASRRIRVGAVLNDAAATATLAAAETHPPAGLPGGEAAEPGATPSSATATGAPGTESSFAPIADAVTAGVLGVDAADRVLRVLGPVADVADPDLFAQATATLLSEAATCDADQVGSLARGVRDTLNRAGVADREEHLRSQRALKRGTVVDGLRRVSLVLDPESDLLLIGALDAAMSPRLGGPRVRDPNTQDAARTLLDDPRTNEQLALDILVDLVRIGVDADPSRMLGASKPAVRVLITADDLLTRVQHCTAQSPTTPGPAGSESALSPAAMSDAGLSKAGVSNAGVSDAGVSKAGLSNESAVSEAGVSVTGVAMLEGHPELVSAATARRYLCNQGALPIILGGDSQPLDLGRTRRLFSTAQRIALSVRDGGCRWPNCDRPPSWTEAHHTTEYQHGGHTNLADGISLCRRHHLLLHNNDWSIHHQEHTNPTYWLRPPTTIDPTQTPIPMPPQQPPPTDNHAAGTV